MYTDLLKNYNITEHGNDHAEEQADKVNKDVIFKNCPQFRKYIS